MNHRHLRSRVLAIAGAVAAVTFVAVHVAPAGADPGSVQTIEDNASASVAAVRLNPPTTSTTTTTPVTTVPGGKVPAELTPLACGLPLNNFGDGRSGGRVHEGDDIAAPQNTPVYAVVDGTLYRQVSPPVPNDTLSGNAWYLRDDATGAYYFYAHLDHFADLPVGSTVKAGDVIAYVGDTGNPGPGNYHLHFEIHPYGNGTVINPQPYLDVTPCPK